jgi:hypothetical protein
MKTVCRFVTKFASMISCVLHCFDRVIFKGHLPLLRPEILTGFVDYVLRVRRSAFMKKLAPQYSEQLVAHAKNLAGRNFVYRTGKFRKEEWAAKLLREQGIREGLIGVLCTQETCRSFRLKYGEGRPQFVAAQRQQRVLYYYYLDPQFGFMHIRLETWFPFTLQVYVNGHDWLAQQMAARQLGFEQRHNAFVQLDDAGQAQKQADRFAHLNWPKILDRWARRVNPLLKKLLRDYSYYWVTNQAEYATDLLFSSRSALQGLFAKLLQHAVLCFSAQDVLGFLGRKLDRRFTGEVQTEYKTARWPGARIKHRMMTNWLKMYDKFGLILRVETVINDPSQFQVYRKCQHRDGSTSTDWYDMPKGVAYLPHYQEQALACNLRYLNALAVVDDPAPAYRALVDLTEAKRVHGRSCAGFNPARREDLALFAAVLDGNHVVRGFANKDIRQALWGEANTTEERHRQAGAVNRRLKRMHIRGWLAKVPHHRRWRVTNLGRNLLSKALDLYRRMWPELQKPQAA